VPGTSAGTGQPLSFHCSACRLREGAIGPRTADGWADRVKLTGRTKPAKHGNARGRSSETRREYTCLDCGHTGWSRHRELERKK